MFDRSRPAGCAKFGRCGRGAPPSFESGNSNFGWPSSHPGPSGQKPARKRGHGALRVCRLRQRGPCLQKPRAYHGHSFTLSSGRRCRNMQSLFEHSPKFEKNQHSGMRSRSSWCRNVHSSPFLHSPRSQCLQTTWRRRGSRRTPGGGGGDGASRSTPRSSSRSRSTQETSIPQALRQAQSAYVLQAAERRVSTIVGAVLQLPAECEPVRVGLPGLMAWRRSLRRGVQHAGVRHGLWRLRGYGVRRP